MPVYLLTWHAYGSWLPDRKEGYVHWQRGLEKTNVALAVRYRDQQRETTAVFHERLQEMMIEAALNAAQFQKFRLHFFATEPTHVHALVSWRDERTVEQIIRSLRTTLSLALNQFEKRTWFSRCEDKQPVVEQRHFDHLVTEYLPSHRGWKFCERRGIFLGSSTKKEPDSNGIHGAVRETLP